MTDAIETPDAGQPSAGTVPPEVVGIIAERIQIEGVLTTQASFFRAPQADAVATETVVNFVTFSIKGLPDRDHGRIVTIVRFQAIGDASPASGEAALEAEGPSEQQAPLDESGQAALDSASKSQRMFLIQAEFCLLYSIASFEGIDDAAVQAFAEAFAEFHAWPYWREFAQSASVRMGLPPLIAPVHRS